MEIKYEMEFLKDQFITPNLSKKVYMLYTQKSEFNICIKLHFQDWQIALKSRFI